jgi:hypothetical protein
MRRIALWNKTPLRELELEDEATRQLVLLSEHRQSVSRCGRFISFRSFWVSLSSPLLAMRCLFLSSILLDTFW